MKIKFLSIIIISAIFISFSMILLVSGRYLECGVLTSIALLIISRERLKNITISNEIQLFKSGDVVFKWDGRPHEFINQTDPNKGIKIISVEKDYYQAYIEEKKIYFSIHFIDQIKYWKTEELRHMSKASAEGFDYQRTFS